MSRLKKSDKARGRIEDRVGRARSLRTLHRLTNSPSTSGERLTDLLVPADGNVLVSDYAPLDPTWFFRVPSCFADSLDILYTQRMVSGKARQVLTQGRNFSFKAGAIIYDSGTVCGESWEDSLRSMQMMLQIKNAQPVSIINGVRDEGHVEFVILSPDSSHALVVETQRKTVSQDHFIRFLVTGSLPRKLTLKSPGRPDE